MKLFFDALVHSYHTHSYPGIVPRNSVIVPELVSGAEITSFVPDGIGFGAGELIAFCTKELVSRKLINAVLYHGIGLQLIN